MKKLFFLFLLFSLTFPASFAQSWFELGTGTQALNANEPIITICADTNNNIYAAGDFTDTLTTVLFRKYVAKWNSATHTWSELGIGSHSLNANERITTICTDKLGNVYAAGGFTDSVWFMTGYFYVAKWDGISWSEMGTDSSALKADGPISSICSDDSGHIYAAGNFRNSFGFYYVAKWDGTKWRELGSLQANLLILLICFG